MTHKISVHDNVFYKITIRKLTKFAIFGRICKTVRKIAMFNKNSTVHTSVEDITDDLNMYMLLVNDLVTDNILPEVDLSSPTNKSSTFCNSSKKKTQMFLDPPSQKFRKLGIQDLISPYLHSNHVSFTERTTAEEIVENDDMNENSCTKELLN